MSMGTLVLGEYRSEQSVEWKGDALTLIGIKTRLGVPMKCSGYFESMKRRSCRTKKP